MTCIINDLQQSMNFLQWDTKGIWNHHLIKLYLILSDLCVVGLVSTNSWLNVSESNQVWSTEPVGSDDF